MLEYDQAKENVFHIYSSIYNTKKQCVTLIYTLSKFMFSQIVWLFIYLSSEVAKQLYIRLQKFSVIFWQ